MIDKITLKNFKSFEELKGLPIKPITIISGTNSCGKSTILQSILLLKQTIESRNPSQTILLNGRLVHLGMFHNLIHKKDIDKTVEINFKFKFKKQDITRSYFSRRSRIPISIFIRELVPEYKTKSQSHKDIDYVIEYTVKLKQSSDIKKNSYSRMINVDECSFSVDLFHMNEIVCEGSRISLKRNIDDKKNFTANWTNIKPKFMQNNFPESYSETISNIEFSNLFPQISRSEKNVQHFYEIISNYHIVNELLREIFRGYTYIGPLREEPARRYIFEDEVIEIGTKGENAAYIYLSEQDNILDKHYFLNKNLDSFVEEKQMKLKKAVNKWLSIMGISDFTAEPSNEIIQLMLSSSQYDKTKINIADVGFGVSQIFPIVLEGLRMKGSQTLVLEQPEIHLHPNLQMLLADYLLSLSLSGKKVIVETHSDHIINRLVRRIVEDEKYNLSEIVGIYFVKPSESGSLFEEIKIDESVGIANWPVGFFDQTASEQEKIIKAGLKKRLKRREGDCEN